MSQSNTHATPFSHGRWVHAKKSYKNLHATYGKFGDIFDNFKKSYKMEKVFIYFRKTVHKMKAVLNIYKIKIIHKISV